MSEKSSEYTVYDNVTSPPTHPLDILNESEIKITTDLVREFFKGEESLRFCRVFLKEPPRDYVNQFDQAPDKVQLHREAYAVVFVRATQKTYEVEVALTPKGSERVLVCNHIPGVQPNLTANEYEECETIVRADPRVREIMRKKGITDMSQVMVDLWVGFYNDPKERIAKPLLFLRKTEEHNLYAKPIDGVEVTVDMAKMKVIDVRDIFDAPIPPDDEVVEYLQNTRYRPDLRPLNIVQPEGVSFSVDRWTVKWQNWSFRIGFNTWDGLVLRQIKYTDKGKVRPVVYRASIAEMVVPYGDNKFPNTIKNAFDAAEDGLGSNAHTLEYGCDCVGAIHYFDVVKTDSVGNPVIMKKAICLHEEDYGILWKHKEWRTDRTDTRRSRRLVLSFFTSIANYDYGFYWYFYMDGSIKCEAKLTGILSVTAIKDGDHPGGFGTMVGPNIYGPIHQHFFTARLDMDVDGPKNAVQEVNVYAAEPDRNPYKQSFYANVTTFRTEREAQRNVYPFTGRFWRVVNPSKKNRNGETCGYKLVTGSVSVPFAFPESTLMKRAGYLKYNIWVTPSSHKEIHPAGDYPMQRMHEDGLSLWSQQNRNIYNTEIVIWYTFGLVHVTRAEDWPVMPTEYVGFELKPENFFDSSPAMDVPPSINKTDNTHCHAPHAKL